MPAVQGSNAVPGTALRCCVGFCGGVFVVGDVEAGALEGEAGAASWEAA